MIFNGDYEHQIMARKISNCRSSILTAASQILPTSVLFGSSQMGSRRHLSSVMLTAEERTGILRRRIRRSLHLFECEAT